jgi:hypothetical protein
MTHIDLYLALAVGSAVSLLFAERFQLLPAGIVVPGYLALLVLKPWLFGAVFAISLLTFTVVKYGIGRFTILYGRRKFTAMLLCGIVFSLAVLDGVGVIVPGLIANTMERQGVWLTVRITCLLTAFTFALLMLIKWLFMIS